MGMDLNEYIARSSDFHLEIDDDNVKDLGRWTKVSGLGANWSDARHTVGDNTTIWVCAGRTKYDNLTLERPVCESSAAVQDWLKDTARDIKPSSAAIKLVEADGKTVIIEWNIRACFPLSWKIGQIESGQTKPMMETLTLVHTGFLEDEKDFRKSSKTSTAG